jgi:hypothetical protein
VVNGRAGAPRCGAWEWRGVPALVAVAVPPLEPEPPEPEPDPPDPPDPLFAAAGGVALVLAEPLPPPLLPPHAASAGTSAAPMAAAAIHPGLIPVSLCR